MLAADRSSEVATERKRCLAIGNSLAGAAEIRAPHHQTDGCFERERLDIPRFGRRRLISLPAAILETRARPRIS